MESNRDQKLKSFKNLNIRFKHSQTFSNTFQQKFSTSFKKQTPISLERNFKFLKLASTSTQHDSNGKILKRKEIFFFFFFFILSFLSNLSKGKKNPRIFNPPNARQKVHDSARLASKLRKKNTVSKNGLQTHVCRGEVRSDRSTLTRIYRATNFQGEGRDARWRDGIRLDTFPPLPDSPPWAPGIVILSVGWTELTDLAGTRVQLRRFPPGI